MLGTQSAKRFIIGPGTLNVVICNFLKSKVKREGGEISPLPLFFTACIKNFRFISNSNNSLFSFRFLFANFFAIKLDIKVLLTVDIFEQNLNERMINRAQSVHERI